MSNPTAPLVAFVDDEENLRKTVALAIRKDGYRAETFADGLEAWESFDRGLPDLVVLDVVMPRLDGLGLVKKVRENPETADLPIFMLTAKGFELSHDELAARWNVMAVIAKPFSPRDLLQRVDGVLGERNVAKPQAAVTC